MPNDLEIKLLSSKAVILLIDVFTVLVGDRSFQKGRNIEIKRMGLHLVSVCLWPAFSPPNLNEKCLHCLSEINYPCIFFTRYSASSIKGSFIRALAFFQSCDFFSYFFSLF